MKTLYIFIALVFALMILGDVAFAGPRYETVVMPDWR